MRKPFIVINNNKIEPARPLGRTWLESTRSWEIIQKKKTVNEQVLAMLDSIALVFSNEAVTPDSILDNVPVDEVFPLYKQTKFWVDKQVTAKLDEIPNAETPTD